jgi:hypothetical protein
MPILHLKVPHFAEPILARLKIARPILIVMSLAVGSTFIKPLTSVKIWHLMAAMHKTPWQVAQLRGPQLMDALFHLSTDPSSLMMDIMEMVRVGWPLVLIRG